MSAIQGILLYFDPTCRSEIGKYSDPLKSEIVGIKWTPFSQNYIVKHTVVQISNVCSKSGLKTYKLVSHRTSVRFLIYSAVLEVSESVIIGVRYSE